MRNTNTHYFQWSSEIWDFGEAEVMEEVMEVMVMEVMEEVWDYLNIYQGR